MLTQGDCKLKPTPQKTEICFWKKTALSRLFQCLIQLSVFYKGKKDPYTLGIHNPIKLISNFWIISQCHTSLLLIDFGWVGVGP